ncbi:TAXI family TRAP transporter solute-binding subunit, partial [Nocardiopsis alkaliphila]|uniref:TAXI family TRAP transporter solute-binding subunit n=1 Tax=Nocardiopsis alkaliphila TaxID=225762 RepID=UPI000527E2AE
MRAPGPTRRAVLLGGTGALLGAMTGCTRDPAPELARIVVATGPPGAVYREIGGAIARLLDEHFANQEVITVETGASHDNLLLLASGDADLGLANLDSILATDVTSEESTISSVGRLYDSF